MTTTTEKISLRGTLAGDVAKRLSMSAYHPDLFLILSDILQAHADDIICIPDGGGVLMIGRKSELGMFPPDW